jgi:hypothetical protein
MAQFVLKERRLHPKHSDLPSHRNLSSPRQPKTVLVPSTKNYESDLPHNFELSEKFLGDVGGKRAEKRSADDYFIAI